MQVDQTMVGVKSWKPRRWQSRCLDTLNRKYAEKQVDVLVVACPGGGKTSLAMMFAKQGKESERFDFVVIAAPSRQIKRQWVKSAAKIGLKIRSNLNNEELGYNIIPADLDGYCVTYSQLEKEPETQAVVCSRKRVLAIMDEVHHAGENNTWGTALRTSFEDAEFRLLMSGTPFRSDKTPIPFVRYDETGLCVRDFTYSYGQALADEVCRPVHFPHFAGQMEWMNGIDLIKARFDDDLDKAGESHRLRTALDIGGALMQNMITSAHNRLLEIRQHGGHENAGGLIVAMSKDHASQIANFMKKTLNVDPVVVHHDDKTSSEKIVQFENSNDCWLVAINMVSEGVDIPRLRVGVHATNKLTEMHFRQFVGRYVRIIEGLDEQTAFIYIPADPRLVDMAKAIEEEQNHYLMENENEKRGPGEPTGKLPFPFIPLKSDGYEAGHIASSVLFSADELEPVVEYQKKNPEWRGKSPASIAKMLRDLTGHIAQPIGSTNYPEMVAVDPDVENKNLRTKSNLLTSRIAYKLHPAAGDDEFRTVNQQSNSAVGISKLPLATSDQLLARIKFQQEWLKQLEWSQQGS